MSTNTKVKKFMEKIFLVGTAYFISQLIRVMPQEVIMSMAHCGAVLITALFYALTLLAFLYKKQ